MLDGVKIIDGTARYLIPGLWDMHVHLTYDKALGEVMPRLFLSYGVTSVRDTGGLLDKLLPVVQAMRAEGAVAPRVFFSGPLLDGQLVVYDGVGRPEIGIPNPSPEVARANVAKLKAAEVDFIKIYEMVSPEVFDALVEAADEHGLPVAMHVPLSLRAGQVACSAAIRTGPPSGISSVRALLRQFEPSPGTIRMIPPIDRMSGHPRSAARRGCSGNIPKIQLLAG